MDGADLWRRRTGKAGGGGTGTVGLDTVERKYEPKQKQLRSRTILTVETLCSLGNVG